MFLLISLNGIAQNTRIKDNNTIGWYALNGTFRLNKTLSLLTEYQWRRDNLVTDWQQSLLRTGLSLTISDKVSLRAGYAWAETYNYGDIPINAFGKGFSEHRIYEAVVINNALGILETSQRLMLEQRWIGRYNSAMSVKQDNFFYVNRLRYLYRIQLPLKGKKIADRTPYAALYDEVLIGFGKNVNENVFDQNRVGILLGYRFTPQLKLEGGFLSQIVQLPREVNGSNVFQYNNGLSVSLIFNSDLLSKKGK